MKTKSVKPLLNDSLCLSPFLHLSFSSLPPVICTTCMKHFSESRHLKYGNLKLLLDIEKQNWQNKTVSFTHQDCQTGTKIHIYNIVWNTIKIFKIFWGENIYIYICMHTRGKLVLLLYPCIMLCFLFPCIIFQSNSFLGLAVTDTMGRTGFAVLCCQRTQQGEGNQLPTEHTFRGEMLQTSTSLLLRLE